MDRLTSFTGPIRAVVAGASGGIGAAFVQHLLDDPSVQTVYALSRSPINVDSERCVAIACDFDDEETMTSAAERVRQDGPIQLLIAATGLLHEGDGLRPERRLLDLDSAALQRLYAVNAVGPIMLLKAFAPSLDKEQKTVFAALSARVGSIEDNQLGGWYGYRASKSGLNMLLKCASIELARTHKHCAVIGLHPGTVDTDLSKPFQRNVPDGKLFTPQYSAECLLKVIDTVGPADTGQIFDWQGLRIPY